VVRELLDFWNFRELNIKKKNKLYNLRMALVSASAFQDLANSFISVAEGISPENGQNFVISKFGHLIASATNMSFAVEIYLKAIIVPPSSKDGHDLLNLFNMLPSEVSAVLQASFEKKPKKQIGKIGCFHLHSQGEMDSTRKKFDIKSILESSKDAFVTWRYLYESTEGEKRKEAVYEFYQLNVFSNVLKEYLIAELG
jgi:hypothetical protein